MILELLMAAALGMIVGFVITVAAIMVGRSPVLERRRWREIWALGKWLKDLQDFIDDAFEEIKRIDADQEALARKLEENI